jgi:hypothetical protein
MPNFIARPVFRSFTDAAMMPGSFGVYNQEARAELGAMFCVGEA